MLLRSGLIYFARWKRGLGDKSWRDDSEKKFIQCCGEGEGNRQLALLQFSFHAREKLESLEGEKRDTNFAVSTLDLIVRLIHKFVENNLQGGKKAWREQKKRKFEIMKEFLSG